MPDNKTKAEDIPFMMIGNGKITSNMDYWVGGIESDGYLAVAKCSPIKISTLTQNLADSITASPDPGDADALKKLVFELKSSLETIEQTIEKLDKA